MTGKRFSVTQTILGSGIYDFQAENELCESYDEDAYSKVVKKLNELHEKNQYLKKAEVLANQRGEIISFANSLIDDLGSETMREMWNEFKEEQYKKWRDLE